LHARLRQNVLRELGCHTALSLFGSEHNQFNALNHVDVNYLKIDPGVVREPTDKPQTPHVSYRTK